MPGPGELVVAVEYFSIDPAMRRWIAPSPFGEPVAIGDVMEASAIGRVTASEHAGFAVGEYLYGGFGVQEFARSDGTGVTKLDPSLAPLTAYLGALGIPGLTAYFGLLDIGHPSDGETVVVSAAAGGVGSIAGQIARIKGCRVIGIAGGPEKCRWIVDELGFHAAIDYKAEDVASSLGQLAPDGIDVFLDNVGGEILDAVLSPARTRGARGPQRRPVAVQRRPDPRTVQLPPADRGAGVDDRVRHAGLRRPISAGTLGAGGMAARRPTDLPRADHRRRRSRLPRRRAEAVRRRERRQADHRRSTNDQPTEPGVSPRDGSSPPRTGGQTRVYAGARAWAPMAVSATSLAN